MLLSWHDTLDLDYIQYLPEWLLWSGINKGESTTNLFTLKVPQQEWRTGLDQDCWRVSVLEQATQIWNTHRNRVLQKQEERLDWCLQLEWTKTKRWNETSVSEMTPRCLTVCLTYSANLLKVFSYCDGWVLRASNWPNPFQLDKATGQVKPPVLFGFSGKVIFKGCMYTVGKKRTRWILEDLHKRDQPRRRHCPNWPKRASQWGERSVWGCFCGGFPSPHCGLMENIWEEMNRAADFSCCVLVLLPSPPHSLASS